ncbi:MAG: hypothetical protein NT002_04370 [candidate division Zixibacteria bacterium]|nr:hypothetical protein [candidate division Zixibacteria bacterium]
MEVMLAEASIQGWRGQGQYKLLNNKRLQISEKSEAIIISFKPIYTNRLSIGGFAF